MGILNFSDYSTCERNMFPFDICLQCHDVDIFCQVSSKMQFLNWSHYYKYNCQPFLYCKFLLIFFLKASINSRTCTCIMSNFKVESIRVLSHIFTFSYLSLVSYGATTWRYNVVVWRNMTSLRSVRSWQFCSRLPNIQESSCFVVFFNPVTFFNYYGKGFLVGSLILSVLD